MSKQKQLTKMHHNLLLVHVIDRMTASGQGFSKKSVRDGLQRRSISSPCTKKKENHASVLFFFVSQDS